MTSSPRTIVKDEMAPNRAKELWTAGYAKALPITINHFELSAVLPAIFYMFRFGERRGPGAFLNAFAPDAGTPQERRRDTTILRVAGVLARRGDFLGFDDGLKKAILGDLLLCFALENVRHEMGRDKQIQRVAPTHYMASWIDLPDSVAHLRHVPEMIVGTLVNQEKGDHVEPTDKGRFPVASGYDDNPILSAFSQGVLRTGLAADRAGDRFQESDDQIGIDQMLMIRLAQEVGVAPDPAKGRESRGISNQRPIAELAAHHFSEDIRRFLRSYASEIPRLALVDMLESCMATGIASIITSTVEILFQWLDEGGIPNRNNQSHAQLFVDCSTGIEKHLRTLAEQSFDDWLRRLERVPMVLATLRVLDYEARNNNRIKKMTVSAKPYATAWLNLLGEILRRRHTEADFIHATLERDSNSLASALDEADYSQIAATLRNEASEPNVVRRLAIALTEMMGVKVRSNLMDMVDSTMQVNRPNGLAQKRRTTRGVSAGGTRRQREVRSLVFSDAVLEYLVHVHLLPVGSKQGVRRLSVGGFLEVLRERYGFYVDVAPVGLSVSNELLRLNRRTLERRLRDLGLLVGVNDAESMKRLRPRFHPKGAC